VLRATTSTWEKQKMTFGYRGLHTHYWTGTFCPVSLYLDYLFIARFLADLFLISFLNILEMIST
jgi:hypothetical protein